MSIKETELYTSYGQMYYEYQALQEKLEVLEQNIIECRNAISEIKLIKTK